MYLECITFTTTATMTLKRLKKNRNKGMNKKISILQGLIKEINGTGIEMFGIITPSEAQRFINDNLNISTAVVHDVKDLILTKIENNKTVSTATFKLKKINADGHCAFRAIAQGLSGGKLEITQESAVVSILRCKLCTYLLRFRRMKTESGMIFEDLVLAGVNVTFEKYVREMKTKTYAGELEFMILSSIMKMHLTVFEPVKRGRRIVGFKALSSYGSKFKNRPVYLCWQRGKRSESGNHYNLLLPK